MSTLDHFAICSGLVSFTSDHFDKTFHFRRKFELALVDLVDLAAEGISTPKCSSTASSSDTAKHTLERRDTTWPTAARLFELGGATKDAKTS